MAKQTRLVCGLGALLTALALANRRVFALTWKATWATDVSFAVGAVALPEAERSKLREFLAQIQARGACIEAVIAHGSAHEGEEGDRARARALALKRADYVANLVKVHGVRSEVVHAAIPVAVLDGTRSVTVEVVGFRRGAPTCQ